MEIIQVIIFIVIIAVAIAQQILKASKKEKVTSPKDVLADMFPEIEGEEQPVSPVPQMMRKPKSSRKQSQPTAVTMKPNISPQPEKENKKPSHAPIKLSTREEARWAFIYSEIFNRKY
ncbi:hypothetical protein [Phocaeicola sp.]